MPALVILSLLLSAFLSVNYSCVLIDIGSGIMTFLILFKSLVLLYSFNYSIASYSIIAIFRKMLELQVPIPYALLSATFDSRF